MYDLHSRHGDYSIWQCVMGDWYVFHGDRMINDTLYKGVDNLAQAQDLMRHHMEREMKGKSPKMVSNVRLIPQPKKGAGEVTMACYNKPGGKTK